MKKLLLALLFPLALFGQSITTQPTNQIVTVGQTATFMLTVSGGPCRSVFIVNGAGHYGPFASTISYSLPNVTLPMSGWKVQVELYGCTGGTAALNSNAVTLTVIPVVTLQSLAIATPQPIIGIGQTDSLTVNGVYSDGTTKDLTSTAAWTSSDATIASVSSGAALGVASGSATVTVAMGTISAFTTITVEPVLSVTFLPSNEDGTVPAAILVINQIVANADGTFTSTPVLQLPDPSGATTLPMLYSPTLLYSAAFFLNNTAVGQPLTFSPTLMTLVMPKVKQESLAVVLCVTTCPVGAVKSMSWTAN